MGGFLSRRAAGKRAAKVEARADGACGQFIPGERPCRRPAKGKAVLNTCGNVDCISIAMVKNGM
jgi:hypothetical protein